MIIEVALTATSGQTRTSHYDTNRPLRVRYDQKIQKYANVAQAIGYRLIPCVLFVFFMIFIQTSDLSAPMPLEIGFLIHETPSRRHKTEERKKR